jgi:hypothetical protein
VLDRVVTLVVEAADRAVCQVAVDQIEGGFQVVLGQIQMVTVY